MRNCYRLSIAKFKGLRACDSEHCEGYFFFPLQYGHVYVASQRRHGHEHSFCVSYDLGAEFVPHDVARSSLPLLPPNIGAWSLATAASFIVFVFLAGVGIGRNSAKPSDDARPDQYWIAPVNDSLFCTHKDCRGLNACKQARCVKPCAECPQWL